MLMFARRFQLNFFAAALACGLLCGVAAAEDDATELSEVEQAAVDLAHYAIYQYDPYPSATKCAACHPGHFREWSVSPHAYAQLSPVFNAMSSKLNKLNNGTLGDFCIRCHTPAGIAMLRVKLPDQRSFME